MLAKMFAGYLWLHLPSDEEDCSMHVNLRGKHWAVVRDDGQVLANG